MKTESDLNDFRQMITKVTVQTALNVELDEPLGYAKTLNTHRITAVMATLVKHSSLMTVRYQSTRLVTVMLALNPSLLKSIRLAFSQWMIRF